MGINMIIVDDELHAIEGIKADLSLGDIAISNLYTSFNIKQAKEIFHQYEIDIMLCDIEMPQGNGLELLAWVKEHSPQTETIILTSHADFRYAKEAIALGSRDYLLKPVLPDELEEAINKIQHIIAKNSELSRNSHSHQLWLKNQSLIIERFWLDIINHVILSNSTSIQEKIEQLQLPISSQMLFLPILFTVKKWKKELNSRDTRILEYALKNSAHELILGEYENGIFFYLEEGKLLGILSVDTTVDEEKKEFLLSQCHAYINSCNQFFYCDISGYSGEFVGAKDVARSVQQLKKLDEQNIAYYNTMISHEQAIVSDQTIELPNNKIWISLLNSNNKQAIIEEINRFIQHALEQKILNIQILHRLHQDILQSLFLYLHHAGIQAQQLFGDEHSRLLTKIASQTIDDLFNWLDHALDKAFNQLQTVEKTETVVEFVKQYIDKNIDQDLSRELIADLVFMNPDHLSRIFKKSSGYSISEYILHARIEIAKDLLKNTNIPISTVSSAIGYSNFSHFSRLFKKHVGYGPTEFRLHFNKQ